MPPGTIKAPHMLRLAKSKKVIASRDQGRDSRRDRDEDVVCRLRSARELRIRNIPGTTKQNATLRGPRSELEDHFRTAHT